MKNNYNAWLISPDDYPKKAVIEEQISFLLRYGILAASTHNTQPWKFQIESNVLKVFPDWQYRLEVSDKEGKNLFISLGCCVENIVVAAAYFGFNAEVETFDGAKSDPYVKVTFVKSRAIDHELIKLFPSITKRHTNKFEYEEKPIDEKIVREIHKNVQKMNITVKLIEDKFLIQKAAELHEKAMISLAPNKGFRKELSQWLRLNNTASGDGVPGFVAGFNSVQALIGKLLLPHLPSMFVVMGKKERQLISNGPLVGVISSSDNNFSSSIVVGRAYERISLISAMHDINSAIMHAVIEDENLAKDLVKIFSIPGKAQMFFRLGYAKKKTYHTPRRNKLNVILR